MEAKRVRLTGTRFEGGRLPVDSLVELQKYQEIIQIAAAAEWRQDNPDQEPPAKLLDSFKLTIERIDEGSADVFLAFEVHQEYVQRQEVTLNVVDDIFSEAYSGSELSSIDRLALVDEWDFRSKLSEFGNTLEPGQTIEYYRDKSDATPITISVESRKVAGDNLLSDESFFISEFVDDSPKSLAKADATLVGRVIALDTDKMTYTFKMSDGSNITGHYKKQPELLEDLRAVIHEASFGPLTRISGETQYKNGDIFRIWSTTSVEKIEFDDTRWGKRLAAFAELDPGWDDNGADRISSIALDAAQTLLKKMDETSVEIPGVFPTVDGGVLLEWGSAESVISVEILEDGTFETFALRTGEARGDHSSEINLESVVDFIRTNLT